MSDNREHIFVKGGTFRYLSQQIALLSNSPNWQQRKESDEI